MTFELILRAMSAVLGGLVVFLVYSRLRSAVAEDYWVRIKYVMVGTVGVLAMFNFFMPPWTTAVYHTLSLLAVLVFLLDGGLPYTAHEKSDGWVDTQLYSPDNYAEPSTFVSKMWYSIVEHIEITCMRVKIWWKIKRGK